jgi:hypothetical protein
MSACANACVWHKHRKAQLKRHQRTIAEVQQNSPAIIRDRPHDFSALPFRIPEITGGAGM